MMGDTPAIKTSAGEEDEERAQQVATASAVYLQYSVELHASQPLSMGTHKSLSVAHDGMGFSVIGETPAIVGISSLCPNDGISSLRPNKARLQQLTSPF